LKRIIDPVITINAVSKAFNGVNVLDGVSFTVGTGQVAALMGLSGTGKSVLLQHMIGLMRPDAGHVIVDGCAVGDLPERDLLVFRRKVGYVFQDSALYDFMTVRENLAFPLRELGHLKVPQIRARAEAYLAMVDLGAAGDKYPSELSGGMRKRAALARALIMEPKVLLCDEPTSGLDPIRSRDISLLIRELSQKAGCTTVVTTHDVPNALRIADRVFVINAGRLVFEGTGQELRSSQEPFVMEFIRD
jgi:phospholipid/cholesterol/gamma-HCH transport system ATP-binding protein